MGTSILKKAAGFLRKKGKYAAALACVVAVSAAGYRAVLPGFTLERELVCGLEEHVHTEACFPPQGADGNPGGTGGNEAPGMGSQPGGAAGEGTTEKVLACPFEGKEAHAHSSDCYEMEKELICGQEESAAESHTHTEECYTTARELTCGQEELAGHIHDASCYQTETNLACGQGESEGHSHSDGCYDENGSLVCGQEESEGHSHGESCYSSEDKLICGQEESAGHTHGESCYTETKELTCGYEETAGTGHTHTEACYKEESKLICGKEEYDPAGHVHGDECYIEKPVTGNGTAGDNTPGAGNGTAGDNTSGAGNGGAGNGTPGAGNGTPGNNTPGAGNGTAGNNTPGTESGTPGGNTENGTATEGGEYQPICGLEEHTHTEACYGEQVMTIADNIVDYGEGWQLDDEGLLTVAATDAAGAPTSMPDYSNGGAPWYKYRAQIKSVKIAEGIERIGNYAFTGCEQLETIEIPEGVREIGEGAFLWCKALSKVTLPNSLETIEASAFSRCGIGSLYLSENVTTIGANAFLMCPSLFQVYIPDTVTKIEENTFYECKRLSRILLSKNITEIGKNAFYGCTALVNISLPEGVETIGEGAFQGCTAMADITIPAGVTAIGPKAFYKCSKLSEAALGENLNSIGSQAFASCGSLNSIIIKSKNLEQIQDCGIVPANVRKVSVRCDSVEVLNETVLSWWDMAKVSLEGAGSVRMEAPFRLGNLVKIERAAGDYYVDGTGALYLRGENGASLAYIPEGLGEYTVPGYISAPDGGQGWAVVSVEKDALAAADGLYSLLFENPSGILSLPDYACGNCPSLVSVNGENTVGGVCASFGNAQIGPLAFDNTGLEGGLAVIDNGVIKITTENGLELASMTTTKETQGTGEGMELYTGEWSKTMVNLPVIPTDTEYAVVRCYFAFTNGEAMFSYGDKDSFTVTNSNGNIYEIKIRKAEAPYTYYYEIPRPKPGDTLSMELKCSYPSPDSGGGRVKIWPVVLTEEENAALGNGITGEDGRYHQVSWVTKVDTFPVQKTLYKNSQAGPVIQSGGEEDENMYLKSLSYEIKMNRAGNTLEGKGKDHMLSAEFTDTLLLPEGMEWKEEILEAVEAGRCSWNSSGLYADIGNMSYKICEVKSNVVLKMPEVIEGKDGKKALKIRWEIKNSTSANEMPGKTIVINFSDNVILVNSPEGGEDENAYDFHIVNEVEAVQHFAHSKDQIQTAEAEVTVQAEGGNCIVEKESDWMRVGGFWGLTYNYTIVLKNSGALPYKGLTSVEDDLSNYLYIKPSNMEAMFREAEKMPGVESLEIKIHKASLCKAGEGSQGYYPGKAVTGTDGNTYTLTWQDTGIGTGYESGRDVGTDPAQPVEGAELSILWEREKDRVLVTSPEGQTEIKGIGNIGRELEAVGYIVTSMTSYDVSWGLDNFALYSGGRKEFRIPVTVKDSFMLLEQDVLEERNPERFALQNNRAEAKKADEVVAFGEYLHHVTGAVGGRDAERDYTLNKGVTMGGLEMDGEKGDTVHVGDVLDYTLYVWHCWNPNRVMVPLVDRMRGAQALLVPTEANGHLAAFGLEEIKEGGESFYLLSKEGSYGGITLGGKLTENITVTRGETGELDTMIRWYLAGPEIWEERTEELSYKAYVTFPEGDGTKPSDPAGETNTFSLSNESWLNDHQSHRLYDKVGILGTNVLIDKKIVASQGGTKVPADDVLTEYTRVHKGESTTYRLKIENLGLGREIAGSQLYDILPQTPEGFAWEKGKNVDVRYCEASEGAYELTGGDSWEVVEKDGRYRIEWGEGFQLKLTGTIYIYVTLEWPEGDAWDAYASEYGAERLENTFWCYKLWAKVTHELAVGAEGYLQKGVYYTELPEINEDGRFWYTNEDREKHAIVYYVFMYNSGYTRLYLNDLQDRLPRGFDLDNTVKSSFNGQLSSLTNQNGEIIRPKWVSGRYCIRRSQGDGKVSIELTSEKKNGDLRYDEVYQKYYLAPGEALFFTYGCYPGTYADTDDIAVNSITMPYDDESGEKLEISKVEAKGPDALNKNILKNDGSCFLMTTKEAEKYGFSGGKANTQWLTSEVTVKRGEIIPGITKKVASVNGNAENTAYAHTADTIDWAITATNSGRQGITDYTLTDAMESPYSYTGAVEYAIDVADGKKISSRLFRIAENGEKDGETYLVLERPARGGTIEYVNWWLNGESISQEQQVEIQRGDVVSFSVTIEKIIEGGVQRDGYEWEYDVCLAGEKGEEELLIRCKSKDMTIPGGRSAALTLSTKNFGSKHSNKTYFNRCYITPHAQQFDGNSVDLGNWVEHNGEASVRNSAQIQVAFGFTTSSEKRVEEVNNKDNHAVSGGEKNIILLPGTDSLFRYTLSVNNTGKNERAMKKLILIDSLPQEKDHNPFTEDEPRFSDFWVKLAEDGPDFQVSVKKEGEDAAVVLPEDKYRLEYSSNTEFGEADWKGENPAGWNGNWDEMDPSKVRSFRVVIVDEDDSEDLIPPGATVEVSFTGQAVSGDDSKPLVPGGTAWNSFGYRYALKDADFELESTPLNVGIRLPDVPKLMKKLNDPDGKPAAAEENMSFRFLIYEGEKLPLKKNFTNEELAEALKAENREFTCVEVTVKEGKCESETVFLMDMTKWEYKESGGWMPTGEAWRWMDKGRYTIVELPLEEEGGYRFDSLGGIGSNGYTFTHSDAHDKKIVAVNIAKGAETYELPETGGTGNYSYTLSGFLCLAAAGLLLRRKKQGAGLGR